MSRSGPFWDAVEGRSPRPPAAATLGAEVVAADPDAGSVEMAFTATDAFVNPKGEVLGGFLSAMLFDTVGPALLATLGAAEFQETLQMSTTFLRPTRPGRLRGSGRVVGRSGDVAFLSASLSDSAGNTVALATATARVVVFEQPGGPT